MHSKQASTAAPIHELIAKRWSPYCFAPEPVSRADLRSLFEAARWAASSYNEQPWRYIVATKDDREEFEKLLSCLEEGNQAWAKFAPVLALGCVSLRFALNGKPNKAAVHDLGLASATLSFEATARGIHVHQMIGILPDKARAIYQIPEDSEPYTGLAIGYVGDPTSAPPKLGDRDVAARSRKEVAEFVFGGKWGVAANATR